MACQRDQRDFNCLGDVSLFCLLFTINLDSVSIKLDVICRFLPCKKVNFIDYVLLCFSL